MANLCHRILERTPNSITILVLENSLDQTTLLPARQLDRDHTTMLSNSTFNSHPLTSGVARNTLGKCATVWLLCDFCLSLGLQYLSLTLFSDAGYDVRALLRPPYLTETP